MTNLRCTADHHAVSPLNIRLVESGIIPDHFQPVEKLIPLTTTSQSGPDQPRRILDQHTLEVLPFSCLSSDVHNAVFIELNGVHSLLAIPKTVIMYIEKTKFL